MEFLSASALSAASAVVLVQQILKLKIVPGTFANKYPVLTNIVLSVIASLTIIPIDWSFTNIPDLLVQVGTVAVVASIAYQVLVKPGLKSEESDVSA